MIQNATQLRNKRRHARQKQRRMASRKLFKSEAPRILRRSSFPLVGELMVWITPKPGELADKIQVLYGCGKKEGGLS